MNDDSIDNLPGTTPVEEQANFAATPARTSMPKRSGKAKTKPASAAKPAGPATGLPDCAALGVAEADVAQFESLRQRFCGLGRRSTEQVFECGAVAATLREIAPGQKAFEKLVKPVLGLSRGGAENYSRAHPHLQPFRDRRAAGAVAASVLSHLAGAEPDKVEEARGYRLPTLEAIL